MFPSTSQTIDAVVRAVALVGFLIALAILLTHWAVRRQLLTPFGWWPRFVRQCSDPLLRPIERRLRSAGANPQDAPVWLLGAALILGLLVIGAERWLLGSAALLGSMRHAGGRDWLRLTVAAATSLLSLAIIVRVIGSWIGMGRYNPWMRPAYWLSDWMIEPIRKRLPAFGPLDLSPIVAYVLVLVLRSLLLSAI